MITVLLIFWIVIACAMFYINFKYEELIDKCLKGWQETLDLLGEARDLLEEADKIINQKK